MYPMPFPNVNRKIRFYIRGFCLQNALNLLCFREVMKRSSTFNQEVGVRITKGARRTTFDSWSGVFGVKLKKSTEFATFYATFLSSKYDIHIKADKT